MKGTQTVRVRPERNLIRRRDELGALQDLLLKCCPANRVGVRSIPILAKKLGVSSSYLYAWIKANRVPASQVEPLVKLSAGKVDYKDFHKYVFISKN